MNTRLTRWAEEKKIIHPNQSGFRKNHSCQDKIFKIIETCRVGLQNGLKCGKTDFDIEKAFDQTPHRGVLTTLKEHKCPDYIGKWLSSYFSERKFVVEVDGVISDEKSIHAGVPQGSPLSPLLFSIYVNDIGNILDRHDINFGLFADDLSIWAIKPDLLAIEQTLQPAINDIKQFFDSKCLKLNEKKCIYTFDAWLGMLRCLANPCLFTNKPKDRINLQINNHRIEYEQHPKSLGIYFDPKVKLVMRLWRWVLVAN
jgi:hypothetical protein